MWPFDWIKGMLSYYMGLLNFLFTPYYPKINVPNADLTGKTIVVTGANSGVGYETALAFACSGARVVLACRSDAKAQAAKKEIEFKSGSNKISVEILDVSSLESVRNFVDRWSTSRGGKIDILLNNAGTSSGPKRTTRDGFELTYQVNMLSVYALVMLLLQRSHFAREARIINTSSQFMFESPRLDPEDIDCSKANKDVPEGTSMSTMRTIDVYARSKAGIVVFTRELQDRLSRSPSWNAVTVNCYHPGIVLSEFWSSPDGISHNSTARRFFTYLTRLVGISAAEASITPYWLATSKEAGEAKGKYWQLCRWRWNPGWMQNDALRHKLWTRWEKDSGVYSAFH